MFVYVYTDYFKSFPSRQSTLIAIVVPVLDHYHYHHLAILQLCCYLPVYLSADIPRESSGLHSLLSSNLDVVLVKVAMAVVAAVAAADGCLGSRRRARIKRSYKDNNNLYLFPFLLLHCSSQPNSNSSGIVWQAD